MKKETWLNCNIMKLSMVRKGHRHISEHLTITGIPIYQHIAYGIDVCSDCGNLHICRKNRSTPAW